MPVGSGLGLTEAYNQRTVCDLHVVQCAKIVLLGRSGNASCNELLHAILTLSGKHVADILCTVFYVRIEAATGGVERIGVNRHAVGSVCQAGNSLGYQVARSVYIRLIILGQLCRAAVLGRDSGSKLSCTQAAGATPIVSCNAQM